MLGLDVILMHSLVLGLGNNNPNVTLTLILTVKNTAQTLNKIAAFLRFRFQDTLICIKNWKLSCIVDFVYLKRS